MSTTAQLQINQSGAWRAVLNFDPWQVKPQFFGTAQDLVFESGSDATMRIVLCEQGSNGTFVATRTVLQTWTRKEGWVIA